MHLDSEYHSQKTGVSPSVVMCSPFGKSLLAVGVESGIVLWQIDPGFSSAGYLHTRTHTYARTHTRTKTSRRTCT